jgi:hypothetical protein
MRLPEVCPPVKDYFMARKDPFKRISVADRILEALEKRRREEHEADYRVPPMNAFCERILWDYATGKPKPEEILRDAPGHYATDKKPLWISQDLLAQLRARWDLEKKGDNHPLDFPDFISLLLWLYATGFISDTIKKKIDPALLRSVQSEKGAKRVTSTRPLRFAGDVELAFPSQTEAL